MELWVSTTTKDQANLYPCQRAPAESLVNVTKIKKLTTKENFLPDQVLKRDMECTHKKLNFSFLNYYWCFHNIMQNLLLE